ncbi:hypothetical protein A3F66_04065 [candidate division TM6 bacterium RIFCSPHIGHO2_12_FULL_32_22]|nr:MAG: hypothetical protein A3F66_04065 [candidate division TM6 bacterium RIFCSPHIGHO2_12_FULL_32_22]
MLKIISVGLIIININISSAKINLQVQRVRNIPSDYTRQIKSALSWSPDGRYLIYYDPCPMYECTPLDGRLKIYDKIRKEVITCSENKLLQNIEYIACSPAGKRIALATRSNFFIADMDSDPTLTPLRVDEDKYETVSIQLAWSSDGKYLAAGLDCNDVCGLLNYEGNTMFIIWEPAKSWSPVAKAKFAAETKKRRENRSSCSIAWSKDNRQIISSLYCEKYNATYKNDPDFIIWDINYKDGTIASVTPQKINDTGDNGCRGLGSLRCFDTHWSGICAGTTGHKLYVHTHNLDNKITRRITIANRCFNETNDYVTFSPDGEFVAYPSPDGGKLVIESILHDNLNPLIIKFGDENCSLISIAWSPDNKSIVAKYTSHKGLTCKMSVFSVSQS